MVLNLKHPHFTHPTPCPKKSATNAAVQDAHEDEDAKMPKLKLGFKLEYDLQTNALGLSLQWTVNRKTSDVVQLEDPNQAQLPLEE